MNRRRLWVVFALAFVAVIAGGAALGGTPSAMGQVVTTIPVTTTHPPTTATTVPPTTAPPTTARPRTTAPPTTKKPTATTGSTASLPPATTTPPDVTTTTLPREYSTSGFNPFGLLMTIGGFGLAIGVMVREWMRTRP